MDEYGKLSDEAYAKYNDTVQVRKLDDGTFGLVNGGDFKTKNGKVIPGMRTLTAKEQARFDEVRAEYDEIQKYFSSANWARNFYQAFVLYDVKTQFAESGVSGDNWSPKRTGSGNPSDPKPNKDPGADPRFSYAGTGADASFTIDPIAPLGAQSGDKLAGIGGVVGGITAVAAFLGMALDAARNWWKNASPEQRQKIKDLINKNANQTAGYVPSNYDYSLLEKYARPIPKKKDLFERVKSKGFFNQDDIKPEFPENPPPKLDPKTGMHPQYGKKAKRYGKLDPISANSMPPTGDPEIDAVVNKQKTINKIKKMARNK